MYERTLRKPVGWELGFKGLGHGPGVEVLSLPNRLRTLGPYRGISNGFGGGRKGFMVSCTACTRKPVDLRLEPKLNLCRGIDHETPTINLALLRVPPEANYFDPIC